MILAFGALLLCSAGAQAEGSNQPYIDELKKDLPPSSGQESYTEGLKRKLLQAEPERASDQSYIDVLKATDPKAYQKNGAQPSFTEEQKVKSPADPARSAIQDLQDGKSELSPNKAGKIRNAFGFRVGVALSHNIAANGSAGKQAFGSVYGTSWAPDILGFYEWQPWHSEFWGNVGIVVSGGLSYYSGKGKFKVTLTNPVTGDSFGADSQTNFRFVAAPILGGANYRFNLARWVRPYAEGSVGLIGYEETRSDGALGFHGISKVIVLNGGVNLLLDKIFQKASWDLYAEGGVKHYYLTVDYSKILTLGSDVNFDVSGVSAGLTYEF